MPNSAAAALPAQMEEATMQPSAISVPELPSLPEGTLDLAKSFGSLLSNINGVVELVDKLAEVTCEHIASLPIAHQRLPLDPPYCQGGLDDRLDGV